MTSFPESKLRPDTHKKTLELKIRFDPETDFEPTLRSCSVYGQEKGQRQVVRTRTSIGRDQLSVPAPAPERALPSSGIVARIEVSRRAHRY